MIDEKLQSLGISLPTPPEPAGSYIPVVISGNIAFVSGQIPLVDGKVVYKAVADAFNLKYHPVEDFLV